MDTRTERDSMGELQVPAQALYAAQTQRAINNFPISGQPLPAAFIQALLLAKKAAAQANVELELLDETIGQAICQAADQLLSQPDYMQHFPVDVFQTGSGTSTNMNANEVLATLAQRDCPQTVSANDHVNYGQSSNDIIPSCIHISAALSIHQQLMPALQHLSQTIKHKAGTLKDQIKTGRTHLMDAMPVSLEQSLLSWASQIDQNITTINNTFPTTIYS